MRKPLFLLVRPASLALLLLLLLVTRYGIVIPLLGVTGFEGYSDGVTFALLAVAVLLIAASSFALNGFNDLSQGEEGEAYNRFLRRRVAPMAVAGLVVSLVAAWRTGWFSLVVPFILAVGLLWFYTNLYKRLFLVGNVIVALLVASLPLLVVLFEIAYIDSHTAIQLAESEGSIHPSMRYSSLLALFIFAIELVRQLLRAWWEYERGLHPERDTLSFRYGALTNQLLCGSLLLGILLFAGLAALSFWGELSFVWSLRWVLALLCLLVFFPLLVASILSLSGGKAGVVRAALQATTLAEAGVLILIILPQLLL